MIFSIGEALIDIFEKEGQELLGGTSANFCATIAKLGGKASIITKLGKYGAEKIISELTSIGVDTSKILIDPIHPTGKVIVSSIFGNSLCERRKLCADCFINEQEIDCNSFSANDVLHFCSFALRECSTKYALQNAIDAVYSKGGKIAFDINLRLRQWKDKNECLTAIENALCKIHYLKASEEELLILYNKPIAVTIATFFAISPSLSVVILSKGENGSALYTRSGEVFYSSAYPTSVVDTTGAGDCLFASAIFMLISQQPSFSYQEIIDFSTAASSLQVQKLGGIAGIPSTKQIKEFMENYHDF